MNSHLLKQQLEYNVTVDNQVHSYTLRGLAEGEIRTWAEFCASVFANKASPPSPEYFERHYVNDPNVIAAVGSIHHANSIGPSYYIRVAVYQNEIVASCRIFLRTISAGSPDKTLLAGGIGEVCTANTLRRRGLSRALMENAMSIMKETMHDATRSSFQISLLHCAPQFVPLYQSLGYECSTTHWSTVQWTFRNDGIASNLSSQSRYTIRLARFPQDTPRLQRLHQKYSEGRLVGCIVRSLAYWNQYLSVELKGSIYILVDEQANQQENQQLGIPGGLVAWLSIRPRDGCFQLREFGLDQDQISTACAITYLLPHALKQEKAVMPGSLPSNVISLSLPTFVLDEIQSTRDDAIPTFGDKDWISKPDESDTGWMYLVLIPRVVDLTGFRFRPEDVTGKGLSGDVGKIPIHFIWPSDSF